ncbi:iron uptake system protein EfeO [Pseudonocardia hydrocarbonoxydans]|uniref:Lipoprotein n=1 Tax=Pseudonocardia hydrocarbonoxydans TaxID=76726 RepID=A0A4Y3WTC9_9PSEU|nr:iron uptake system protein EfeO [Pseudonocardia hydrocarbonoxydans]GEC20606.1 lipoprotein [Pseudonocardia hydrocarbonoxydans]
MSRTTLALAGLSVAGLALTGCVSTAPAPDTGEGGPISVTASDDACELGATEAAAGTISFDITNTGSTVTEFYLYATGGRIMGEVENIGPGLSRQLIVEVPDGGVYETACKPGMVGDGIRGAFTVTGSAQRSVDTDTRLAEATAGYARYVASQVEALVPRTQEFTDAVKAGDVAGAQALYPVARTYWERIEPVAESFGDLDPRIDGRDDGEPGVEFTGFHRLERDLWQDGLQPDSAAVADRLMADITELAGRVPTVELTPLSLANGAKELLDEVATGKITGEENRYSHTDLWDFRANVDGSRGAVAALRPVIDERDPELGALLDERFAAVDALLEDYRDGDGFVLYTALTPDDVRAMSDAVDALGEPVSQVAGVVSA